MKNPKIKEAEFDNKKKTIKIYYSDKRVALIHYGQLGIKNLIKELCPDDETDGQTLRIHLVNGKIDYMPSDQALYLSRDPKYLLQLDIERFISTILIELKRKKISKHFLAEKLGTSDNQIQRILDPNILNKNLEQLYKIFVILGIEPEWSLKKVAA